MDILYFHGKFANPFFFWRLSLSEFHAMSEVSSWVLLRWTFLAQFLFFSSLQTKAKECQCDIRRNFYFFGRISYKICKSWILCLTEICDSFVLLRWFLFLHRVRKILEIKLYSVILNECKKSECVAFSLIFFAPYHVWLYKNQINLDASGLFLAAL